MLTPSIKSYNYVTFEALDFAGILLSLSILQRSCDLADEIRTFRHLPGLSARFLFRRDLLLAVNRTLRRFLSSKIEIEFEDR